MDWSQSIQKVLQKSFPLVLEKLRMSSDNDITWQDISLDAMGQQTKMWPFLAFSPAYLKWGGTVENRRPWCHSDTFQQQLKCCITYDTSAQIQSKIWTTVKKVALSQPNPVLRLRSFLTQSISLSFGIWRYWPTPEIHHAVHFANIARYHKCPKNHSIYMNTS